MSNAGIVVLREMAGRRVLVLGEAILDAYVTGHVARLCREAPVPILDVDTSTDAAGGAANTAANIESLGGEAIFVSLIGGDSEGDRVLDALREVGVDTGLVLRSERRRTLAKQRLLTREQMLLRFDAGTTRELEPGDERPLVEAIEAAHSRADAVLVSDYGYGIVTPGVRDALARLQARRPLPLVVDARDLRTWARLRPSAVKPNYGEAVRLLGLDELHDSGGRAVQVGAQGARLLELTGARLVALTLDHDGAIGFEAGRPAYRTYARPAASARAAGAGDTFAAVLALGLAVGLDAPTLLDIAAAAAAIVVARDGTSTCSAHELAAVLATVRGKRVDGPSALARRLAAERAAGRRIVFTNGCFDIIHRGHVTYLNRAKALADILVVAVNDDASVRRLKGADRPINGLDDRLSVLEALSCVDIVVPFAEAMPVALLDAARPDVFVKGGDYSRDRLPEADIVERMGGEVRLLPYVADRSTSAIVRRVRATSAGAACRTGRRAQAERRAQAGAGAGAGAGAE